MNCLVFCDKQEGLGECISDDCNTCSNNPDQVDVEKLKVENRRLKNRCRVMSDGVLCSFCSMECENRAAEFVGEDSIGESDGR